MPEGERKRRWRRKRKPTSKLFTDRISEIIDLLCTGSQSDYKHRD